MQGRSKVSRTVKRSKCILVLVLHSGQVPRRLLRRFFAFWCPSVNSSDKIPTHVHQLRDWLLLSREDNSNVTAYQRASRLLVAVGVVLEGSVVNEAWGNRDPRTDPRFSVDSSKKKKSVTKTAAAPKYSVAARGVPWQRPLVTSHIPDSA